MSRPGEQPMSPVDSIRTVLTKYATFSGRARRSEFWWFQLATTVVFLVLEIAVAITDSKVLAIPAIVLVLALVSPSWGVLVRRLHDVGRSGWWYFIAAVPLVGPIVVLVFTVQDSQAGTNRYGPPPKGLAAPLGYADTRTPPGWA